MILKGPIFHNERIVKQLTQPNALVIITILIILTFFSHKKQQFQSSFREAIQMMFRWHCSRPFYTTKWYFMYLIGIKASKIYLQKAYVVEWLSKTELIAD